MGDMADWNIEQGMDVYTDHLFGNCEGWCQYCEEAAKKSKKPKKRPAKKKKEATP